MINIVVGPDDTLHLDVPIGIENANQPVRVDANCGILLEVTHRPGGKPMAVSIEALGINQLSVRDRLELIELIWDSLPEHVNPDEVPEWHLAELVQRRAEADASPRAGKPWREALARFRSES